MNRASYASNSRVNYEHLTTCSRTFRGLTASNPSALAVAAPCGRHRRLLVASPSRLACLERPDHSVSAPRQHQCAHQAAGQQRLLKPAPHF
jgi:hypothetical protein